MYSRIVLTLRMVRVQVASSPPLFFAFFIGCGGYIGLVD
jgi:hypothetical protein